MRTFYGSLLRLYPYDYRLQYGEEMMTVFLEAHGDISREHFMARVGFGIREVHGLLHGAVQEHLRILAGSHRGATFTPMYFTRRLTMRTEFRFPKATLTLMVVILAAVLLAIDKARSIQESIAPSHTDVGPLHPAQTFMLLPPLMIVMAGALLVGAIGWAILYSLRRSGAQRLSEMNTAGGHSHSGKTLI